MVVVVVVVVSCWLLFLTFSVLVANPKKTTLHGGQSRSWSAEQGKENKRKAGSIPPPHTARSEKINKNHASHLQALRRSRSVSRPYNDTFGSSTRPMGAMGVASQNSTLPFAITSFLSCCFSTLHGGRSRYDSEEHHCEWHIMTINRMTGQDRVVVRYVPIS